MSLAPLLRSQEPEHAPIHEDDEARIVEIRFGALLDAKNALDLALGSNLPIKTRLAAAEASGMLGFWIKEARKA